MEVILGDDEVTGRNQMDSIEERKGIIRTLCPNKSTMTSIHQYSVKAPWNFIPIFHTTSRLNVDSDNDRLRDSTSCVGIWSRKLDAMENLNSVCVLGLLLEGQERNMGCVNHLAHYCMLYAAYMLPYISL